MSVTCIFVEDNKPLKQVCSSFNHRHSFESVGCGCEHSPLLDSIVFSHFPISPNFVVKCSEMKELPRKLVASAIRFYKAFEAVIFRIFLGPIEKLIRGVYKKAGITIDGKNPWDIRVKKHSEFFLRLANNAPMGLGETYMDGVWECDDIAEMITRTLRRGVYRLYLNPWNRLLNTLELWVFNLQTKSKAFEVGEHHYDLGNDLFELMLDQNMNYSCGYWRTAKNLNQAQIDKMDLIAKKLMLKPGMKVLDIGCGWGGLAKHLAKNYGVSVVGITISKEGAKYARKTCSGLPVDIRFVDYRDLNEQFDRIVSVGMFEHVGPKNYDEYFKTAHRCLKRDGIFLLHTIGVAHYDIPCSDPWFVKYIFPNGFLPYYKHITDHIEKKFIIEDWQNFGNDYSKTLEAWHDNFIKHWPKLESKYGDRFFRMWKYYLQFCTGVFRSRKMQLWQVVLSKNGLEGGYYAAR